MKTLVSAKAKKVLLSLLCASGVSAFASVGGGSASKVYNLKDADSYGYMYLTNTFGKAVIFASENMPNNQNYAKFNCLIPLPKQAQQGINSPLFENIYVGINANNRPAYSQGVVLKPGETIIYAVDTACTKYGALTSDSFDILDIDVANNGKLYAMYDGLYMNVKKNKLEFNRWVNKYNEINVLASYLANNSNEVFFTLMPHTM